MKDQTKNTPSALGAEAIDTKGTGVVQSPPVHAQGGGSYRQKENGEFERTGGTKPQTRPLHKSTKAAADAKAPSDKE